MNHYTCSMPPINVKMLALIKPNIGVLLLELSFANDMKGHGKYS